MRWEGEEGRGKGDRSEEEKGMNEDEKRRKR